MVSAVPTLEGIPVELRISILFTIPDPGSLWSLLRASSTYYDAFELVKKDLLRSLLQKHHAGLVDMADAIAAIRSRGLYASEQSNKEKIIALLDARNYNHKSPRPDTSPAQLLDEPANIQETVQLLHLHNQAIFFLENFCKTIRRPVWMDETRWEREIIPLALTETEQRRIIRAFYRLQIYGNIFGSIERTVDAEHTSEDNDWQEKQDVFSGGEMWRLFFGHMAPWEVEEFSCLWEHCCYRYESILREVSDSLVQTGCMFFDELPEDQRPPPGCWYTDCDDFEDPMDKRESLASKGPALLCKVLREEEFLARRDLVLVNVRSFRLYFYDFGIWPRPTDTNEMELFYPADKFNFGTDRNGLREFLKTLPPFERPNLAWERIWLRDDLNFAQLFYDMYEFGATNKHRPWQYALWDDERLIEWKVPILSDDYPFWNPTHDN
nr:hypothetical protein ANI_1_3094014 [Aspergillus niger CBS 513.88]|eukprot:XP_001389569.2 hypothetical protein ANI_1_3094014 [Aspergillus niger CBS 513.88]